jgi:hypothetical protein
MRIKQSELQYLIKESIKKVLLNEISIEDKYQKERDRLNIPFDIFRQLCNLDPTTKPNKVGKYTNWIIAKYNPNTDLRKLQRCLEWYCDGVKRGILTRYNIPLDINKYKSYDEFMTTMDSLSDTNDTSMSQSEYNNRQKLEGQFEVLGSTSFYDIVAPKTYAAERYFGSNTEWCTVANERYFDNYSRKGQLYIIYPKNGDSEYKMQLHFEDEQFANKYDEVYDRPMDCIQQVVKDEGVERDLVVLCKKVFSKYKSLFVSFNERLEDAKQRLLNGESPEKIFNYVGIFSEGYAVVFLNSKWNFINTNGEFLSDTWFDGCGEFHKGLAKVCLNYKENYINTNGELISDTWFDNCREFPNGVVKVELDGKENYINTNGRLLSDTWFDRCGFLCNGFAVVELDGKYNLVNTNGELISDTWFDKCRDFDNGIASVKLNGKWNFINTNGELLSDTWVDKCGHWSGAVVPVELKGKWNYIGITGKFLTNTWFDWCGDFDNGFALIKLNGKYNFINRTGKILSDTWFDECGCWCDGIGRVKVNGKEYEIETNGDGKLYDRNGKLIQKNIRKGFSINESKLKNIKKVLREN